MISPEASDPKLSAATRRLLDTAVDERCLELNAGYNVPIELEENTGIPSVEEIRAANGLLLNFVFVCDARAQVENPEPSGIETAWVGIAQQGIRRMSREIPSSQRLDRVRLFSEADHAEQRLIYQEMAARRLALSGEMAESTGLWYAVRVAMGQIVLDGASARVS